MGKKGDGMPIFNEEMYLYDKNQNSDLFHLHSFGRLYPDADYIISLKENSNTIIECRMRHRRSGIYRAQRDGHYG